MARKPSKPRSWREFSPETPLAPPEAHLDARRRYHDGVITLNEYRAVLGMSPLPGGDVLADGTRRGEE